MPPRRSRSAKREGKSPDAARPKSPLPTIPRTPQGRSSAASASPAFDVSLLGTPYSGPPLHFDDDDPDTTKSPAVHKDRTPSPTAGTAVKRATEGTKPPTEPYHNSAQPTPHSSSASSKTENLDDSTQTEDSTDPLTMLESAQAEKISKTLVRRQKIFSRLHLHQLTGVLPFLLVLVGCILPFLLPIPPAGPFYSNNANNGISKGTYVDENALQPGQAHNYFNYHFDVPYADSVADTLTELGSLPAPPGTQAKNWVGKLNDAQRSFLADEFAKLGMSTFFQPFAFDIAAQPTTEANITNKANNSAHNLPGHLALEGSNVFARFSPPRTDAREALVLCAPWYTSWTGQDPNDPDDHRQEWDRPIAPVHPDQERRVNIRGVATVLAMARYLASRPQSYLSRDYYFLVSDSHLSGAQAWLGEYYHSDQENLQVATYPADTKKSSFNSSNQIPHWDVFGGSVIWNALAVEYPSDSFRSIEVLHEGLNGQLPNMDALNTVVRVAEQAGAIGTNVPSIPETSWVSCTLALVADVVTEYKTRLERLLGYDPPAGLFERRTDYLVWSEYAQRDYFTATQRIWRQWALQAAGTTSSIHGLFTRYHVDAVTIRVVPATGPFGFFHIGRIVEGSLRSYNNLLERLHHSQFFYLLLSGYRFVPFGVYLPSALLIVVGLCIHALQLWGHLNRAVAQQQQADFEHCAQFIHKELAGPSSGDLSSMEFLDVPSSSMPTPAWYTRELYFLASSLSSGGANASAVGPVQRAITRTRAKFLKARLPLSIAAVLFAAAHGAAYVALLQLRSVELVGQATSAIQSLESFTFSAVLLIATPPILALFSQLASGVSSQPKSSPSRSGHSNYSGLKARDGAHHPSRLAGPMLHMLALLHAGLAVAVTSVLNFPLALVTACSLGGALLLLRPPVDKLVASGSVKSVKPISRSKSMLRAVIWSFLGAPQLLLLLCHGLQFPSRVAVWASRPSSHTHTAVEEYVRKLSLLWAPTGSSLVSGLAQMVQARLWDWHVLQTYSIPFALLVHSVCTTLAALGAWLDVFAA